MKKMIFEFYSTIGLLVLLLGHTSSGLMPPDLTGSGLGRLLRKILLPCLLPLDIVGLDMQENLNGFGVLDVFDEDVDALG